MRGAAAAIAVVLLTACGSGTHSPPTSPPPATAPSGEPSLTIGPPSAYTRITIAASGREADVPSSLRSGLAPLLMARDFGPQPLAQYGLDHPQASIEYQSGGRVSATVRIGATDFDRRGFYALLDGDRRVFLVLSDPVRPVLALVGITVAPPAS